MVLPLDVPPNASAAAAESLGHALIDAVLLCLTRGMCPPELLFDPTRVAQFKGKMLQLPEGVQFTHIRRIAKAVVSVVVERDGHGAPSKLVFVVHLTNGECLPYQLKVSSVDCSQAFFIMCEARSGRAAFSSSRSVAKSASGTKSKGRRKGKESRSALGDDDARLPDDPAGRDEGWGRGITKPLGPCDEDDCWGLDSLGRKDDKTGREDFRGAIKAGKHVLVLGCAGAGKSVLIQQDFPSLMAARYGEQWPRVVVLTSTTGVSAGNLGGMTVHAAMGMRTGQGSVANLIKGMSDDVLARWQDRRFTLVIDEAGFLSAQFFDKLYRAGETVRAKKGLDMAGVQFVFVGDFLQLGPIGNFARAQGSRGEKASDFTRSEGDYLFEAKRFTDLHCENYVLVGSKRHAHDAEFHKVLDRISVGRVDAFVLNALQKYCGDDVSAEVQNDPACVYLHAKRAPAHDENHRRLQSVIKAGKPGPLEVYTYAAQDGPIDKIGPEWKEVWDHVQGMQTLDLCKDAIVMATRNSTDNIRNGTMGKVVGFQGIGKAAGNMQAWVDDILATMPGVTADEARRIILLVAQTDNMKKVKWPLVMFGDGDTKLMLPRAFDMLDNFGEVIVQRITVPLMLAYALTVHKAQGLTIPRVVLRTSDRMPMPGQMYTAMSRVRHSSHLFIHAPTVSLRACVKADASVLRWLSDPRRMWRRIITLVDPQLALAAAGAGAGRGV